MDSKQIDQSLTTDTATTQKVPLDIETEIESQCSLYMEPRDSQNFFKTSEVKSNFLQRSLFLYLLIVSPAAVGTFSIFMHKESKNFVKQNALISLICGVVSLIVGLILGMSKIVARKRPINYIFFAIFVATQNYAWVGLATRYEFLELEVLFAFFFINAFTLYFYVCIVKESFDWRHSFWFCFIALVATAAVVKIVFERSIIHIAGYFLLATVVSFIIAMGSGRMILNPDFNLLPNDYIMGSMKILSVVPLIFYIFEWRITKVDIDQKMNDVNI